MKGTVIVAQYGDLTLQIRSSQNLGPDMVDHALDRIGRQLVARARQLGMLVEDADGTVSES